MTFADNDHVDPDYMPGENLLRNWTEERAVGTEGFCHISHVIYRATQGRSRKVSKKLENAIARDLMVWCAMRGRLLSPAAMSSKRAYIQFPMDAAYEWLDAGGRDWITARIGAEIIKFPHLN